MTDDREICRKVNCDKADQYDICVVPFCKQMFEIGQRYYNEHTEEIAATQIPMRLYKVC